MSSLSLPRFSLSLIVAASSVGVVSAAPDLAPPKAREKVVSAAARVVAERTVPAAPSTPPPNPFVAKEAEQAEEHIATPSTATEPTLSGRDLLATLASRFPSTGTVSIGGEPILLLGQKRLKVGDSIAISFEGQSYELSIAAVSSTSFTVKRGENIHTRPVRLSAASTNTPTNRP